jgi:hypothetical protein
MMEGRTHPFQLQLEQGAIHLVHEEDGVDTLGNGLTQHGLSLHAHTWHKQDLHQGAPIILVEPEPYCDAASAPNLMLNIRKQCCGSGRFLTGSGSDFRKRPDPVPDPDPNKFLANFFLKFFLMKICSKKYLQWPKS